MVAIKNRQRVKVRNLAEFGVNTDIEPFELPLNAFTSAMNIDFRGRKVNKSKSFVETLTPSEEAVLKMYSKDSMVYYGTRDGINVYDGIIHNNLSRGGNRIEILSGEPTEGGDYSITLTVGEITQTFTYTSSMSPESIMSRFIVEGGLQRTLSSSVNESQYLSNTPSAFSSSTLYWLQALPFITESSYSEDITFEVITYGATGYRWYKNNILVEGANTNTLVVNDVIEQTDIRVEAFNEEETIQTATRIVVNNGSALVFTKALKDSYSIKEGEDLKLEVEVVGYDPVYYRWFSKDKSIQNSVWEEISGAEGKSYNINNANKTSDYKVEVTGGATTIKSETTVTVKPWEMDTKTEILQGLADKITGDDSVMTRLVTAKVLVEEGKAPILTLTKSTFDEIVLSNPINITVSEGIADLYTPSEDWYITELSNVIVFSNLYNIPQYKSNYTYGFQDLPDWDKNWRTPRIRSYKSFLLAMSTLESGVEYKQRVRWSDIAYPNEPPKSWDATSTTNSAGFIDLSEARGKVVDGLSMGDSFVIYTDEEVFLMDYVAGGDIFRVRKADFAVSILAPECVVQAQGGHVVITNDDIIFHRGGNPQSLVTNKIKESLFNQIGQVNNQFVKMVYLAPQQEIWIMYPEKSSDTPRAKTKVAVYNFTNGTWTFRQIPACYDIHFGKLPLDDQAQINSIDVLIDEYDVLPDGLGKDFRDATLFASTTDKTFIVLDATYDEAGINQVAWLERRYLDFDDVGFESDSIKYITAIHPQVNGTGSLYIKLGSSNTPNGKVEWTDPVIFDIENDYKADFTLNGRYISIRFEILDNSVAEITGYDIEIGRRTTR